MCKIQQKNSIINCILEPLKWWFLVIVVQTYLVQTDVALIYWFNENIK